MGTIQQSKFLGMPLTRFGRWAAGLGALFVVMILLKTNIPIPVPAMIVMAIGIIAGILIPVAIFWKRERSWLLWLMLLPGLFAIVFTVGELLYPH
jgi:hypothetical protein